MSNQRRTVLYHEKQRLGYCAVHSLNNLFQEKWVTYETFSSMSYALHKEDRDTGMATWYSWNPYGIPIFGYFDIACIIKALSTRNCRISSHVLNVEGLDEMRAGADDLKAATGILVNEETTTWGIFPARHWYSIIYDKETQEFLNVDSKLDRPQRLADIDELTHMLTNCVQNRKAQIFIIRSDES